MKKLLPHLLLALLVVFSCESEEEEKDTTAPSVLITYPGNQETLNETTTVRADATDDTAVSSIVFLIDGVEAFTDTEAPYEYEWNVCAEANNEVSVLAKAEDIDGNLSQSELAVYYITAIYDCIGDCGGNTFVNSIDDAENTGLVCDCDSYDVTIDEYYCQSDWDVLQKFIDNSQGGEFNPPANILPIDFNMIHIHHLTLK